MSNVLGLEKSGNPVGGSNKSFGVMFGAIFFIIACVVYLRSGPIFVQSIALVASTFTIVIALRKPSLLAKPNFYWMKFSMLLAKIVSPIVLGVLFFVMISPLAMVLRIFGRDVLLLKRRQIATHWKPRDAKGYTIASFKNQF